ncbi:SDR family oxidoreductase [Mesorhizobium sp. M1E.F.Ca.ET.045.02.1.1]|uniref:SDR family oxidoreductase n=1 Tax=Mesorhizobium sp. M1E.F.Ca.ET.045.02.1.1 TaxID=2493672 RepID=UPI000F7581CA|nr:SDR family oxidoreductase [Mesorhizobium sp. M1E.F.Ca.ET.045.02.1.1]AZO25423.1 SDR family oxidoreductase [Mesorhizobium sp. M1E.F.Ca.ET.045.02.1.1]TKB14629.1 MAG: NAD-dependent epimerase/dehydratase family protein [Mesorhizobium sp.]
MRVFLTGATGFIGSRIVPELLAAGHQVLGLTRSEAGARSLAAAGAEPHRGDIEDLDSLRDGAAKSDAVIHTAFDHNFSNFVANCEKDKRVIEALGDALAGSDRLLIITSGVGMGSAEHGQPAREDVFNTDHANPRILSELTGAAMAEKGVKVSVVRLPQVHDTVKQGLITPLIEQTRAKGVSAYLGEGRNRWSAAHVLDVARLYRLALDKQEAGVRYNAVAEEGISMREIAEVIGGGLNVPVVSLPQEEAADHFGWLSIFAAMDLPASSEWTRAHLGWQPTGPGLIADLELMDYSQAAAA